MKHETNKVATVLPAFRDSRRALEGPLTAVLACFAAYAVVDDAQSLTIYRDMQTCLPL